MSADEYPIALTPSYVEQLEALEPSLRRHYEALVKAYRFYAVVHHQHPFVSYKVLADLVKAGWRRNETPVE